MPWMQPWGTAAAKAPLAMPKSAATGRQYRGINVLILWSSAIKNGFTDQSWLTFRQALSLGGQVRKGERGTTVVYANQFVPLDERRRASETGSEAQAIKFLKRFTLFNIDQCNGLPLAIATTAPPPPPGLIEPQVERLIKATGIDFRIGGDQAFYMPSEDYVRVPPPKPTSSRSIGIARPCMSWRMQADMHHVSTVTYPAATAPRSMPSRSSSRRYHRRLVAPRWVSCRQFGTPTISAPGSKCCARTIARLCEQRRRPARLRTISLGSCRRWLSTRLRSRMRREVHTSATAVKRVRGQRVFPRRVGGRERGSRPPVVENRYDQVCPEDHIVALRRYSVQQVGAEPV